MIDFLTFKSFISTEVLIAFYYLGVIVLPLCVWVFLTWLMRKFKLIDVAYKNSKKIVWRVLNKNQKFKIVIFFVVLFMFMELFWRMLFEFLIAYMQIRDALL